MWFRLVLILSSFAYGGNGLSQSVKPIYFYSLDNPAHILDLVPKIKIRAKDTVDALKKAQLFVDSINSIGYFASYITHLKEYDTTYNCALYLGDLYQYSYIDLKYVPGEIKVQFNLGNSLTDYSVMKAKLFLNKLADHLESNGYQYAQVRLDSTELVGTKMNSILKVDFGSKVFIDSVYLDGNHSLPPKLMKRIINLKTGEHYSKSKLTETIKNISSLPFISITDAPKVSFYQNKALVHIYLKEIKQSRIDALLGVLPSSPPENKLKLNGTFNALLVNQFKAGETITFNFQSLQNSSQHLRLDWSSPYLFNLPFSPILRFNIFRRDSLFQELRAEFGAKWQVARKMEYRALFGSFSSSILKPDLIQIKQSKMLPSALDIRQSYATSALSIDRLNNGALSSNGFLVNLFITGYSRNIKKNVSIISLRDDADTSFSYESLYKPYAAKGYAVEIGFSLDHYLKVKKYSVLYQRLSINYKDASTRLQINEMYRMGGYNTLRGFDEESIFATQYMALKNEFRLMTGSRSYLFCHMDIATMQEYSTDRFKKSNFLSLGAGLAVDTSLGILSVASSIGRKFPNGFDFKAVKLHVGYINYF